MSILPIFRIGHNRQIVNIAYVHFRSFCEKSVQITKKLFWKEFGQRWVGAIEKFIEFITTQFWRAWNYLHVKAFFFSPWKHIMEHDSQWKIYLLNKFIEKFIVLWVGAVGALVSINCWHWIHKLLLLLADKKKTNWRQIISCLIHGPIHLTTFRKHWKVLWNWKFSFENCLFLFNRKCQLIIFRLVHLLVIFLGEYLNDEFYGW